MKERTCYVDQFEYWTSQGRGRGEFAQYRPWLTVFDAKSYAGCDRSTGGTGACPGHVCGEYTCIGSESRTG